MSEENEVAEAQPAVEETPAVDPAQEKFEQKRDAFIAVYKDKVPILNRALNAFNRVKGIKETWNGKTIHQSAYHFARKSAGLGKHAQFPEWLWLKSKVAQLEKRG